MTELFKPMAGLTFDEAPHIYRLDGKQIPSVSQIMEPLSKAKYGGIDDAVLNKAANRGTAVHTAIEIFIKTDGFVDIQPEFAGYMEAFEAWWKDFEPEPLASEYRMYHKLMGYAGTADLLCRIGGKLTLVDYKTSAAVSEKLHGVQLEAYAQALSSHGIEVEDKLILHLKKDGEFKAVDFPLHDGQKWRVFGACKTLYDYIH